MSEHMFLTAEEVAERYRGEISVGTLRNWRSMKVGPPFLKVGKAILYPVRELDQWDGRNLVLCRPPSGSGLENAENPAKSGQDRGT